MWLSHCRDVVKSRDNGSATICKQQFVASLPPPRRLPSNASRVGERIKGVREASGGFQAA
jgi:hypothetical protein